MPSYVVVRRTTINATPERVHELLNDFHHWPLWSPWEKIDPAMQRTYSGAEHGVGARFAWVGNKKAGEGSMEIVSSIPAEIQIDLRFRKPVRSRSDTVFAINPSGHGTEVSWTMSGEQKGLWGLVGRLYPMDKIVGKDFEVGLSQLKAVAESDD
jgi:Polyketide cyclase / dehydrase and lipid transport